MPGPTEAAIRSRYVKDTGAGLGPFIMGYVFNMVLLGVLFAQVWHWRSWTIKERPFISVIVYWVLFGSVVSSIFVIVWEWNLFVAHYGTFIQFTDSSVFSWLPLIDETVVFACQVFNLERSYRLNGRKIIVLILITPFMLATAGLIMARKIATSIQKNPEFNVTQLIQPPPQACLATNVVTDVLLTLSIAYGLWKAKTGWKDTDNLLARVLVFTIKSQLPAAFAATATAVQFATNSKTTMVFLYMITNSKIPAVMFMAVLNFRFELQKDSPTTHVLSSSAGLINVETFNDTASKLPYDQLNDIPLQEQPFGRYKAASENDGQWTTIDGKLAAM